MNGHSMRRGAVIAATALVVLAATMPASRAETAADPGGNPDDLRTAAQLGKQFGFSSDLGAWNSGVSAAREAELIKLAGGSIRRFGLSWEGVQPTMAAPKAPATVTADSSYYPDREYVATVQRGITPVVTILGAPGWASGKPKSCRFLDFACWNTVRNWRPNQPPTLDFVWAYALFARWVAARYPLAAIETWNEPEQGYYWGSKPPDAWLMAKMQCAAYDQVKSVNPNQRVLAPGIGINLVSGPYSATYADFTRTMYTTMGRTCWDVLAVHMYFGIYYEGNGTVLAQMVQALRASRAAAGDRTPVWVTETGVSISTSSWINFGQQVDYHIRAMHKLLTISDISAVMSHTLRDGGTLASYNKPSHPTYGMGMISQGMVAKPGYCHWVKLNGNTYPGC